MTKKGLKKITKKKNLNLLYWEKFEIVLEWFVLKLLVCRKKKFILNAYITNFTLSLQAGNLSTNSIYQSVYLSIYQTDRQIDKIVYLDFLPANNVICCCSLHQFNESICSLVMMCKCQRWRTRVTWLDSGSCDSRERVCCPLNQKVGALISHNSSLHTEVSLGKLLTPQFAHDLQVWVIPAFGKYILFYLISPQRFKFLTFGFQSDLEALHVV